MKFIEQIKLKFRAKKYKNKNDIGGINYVINTVSQGQTALDIGAHKAGYLYFMLQQVGEKGRIYAFEPQLNLYNYIKKIKKLFHWDNVTIENLAISDNKETVTLYIPKNKVSKGSSPGATIAEHKEKFNFDATQSINTETLDSYCERNQVKPDFMKIDVEGNELKIFKGGINILKQYKPKILVEIEARHVGQDKAKETFAFMEALGYKGYYFIGIDRFPISEFTFEKNQNINDMKLYCNNFVFE